MPVARNVWQPILTRVPRSVARRWIMRQASTGSRAEKRGLEAQPNGPGRRLLGSCQAWSRSLVQASLVRSWAALTATVLGALVIGIGIGMWLHTPLSELAWWRSGGRMQDLLDVYAPTNCARSVDQPRIT
jgi:hypothetical protein